MCVGATNDPWYTGPANQFIRTVVSVLTGYDVVTDPDLTDRNFSVDDERCQIRIRPYLSGVRYRSILIESMCWVRGGAEWVPEFLVGPLAALNLDRPLLKLVTNPELVQWDQLGPAKPECPPRVIGQS